MFEKLYGICNNFEIVQFFKHPPLCPSWLHLIDKRQDYFAIQLSNSSAIEITQGPALLEKKTNFSLIVAKVFDHCIVDKFVSEKNVILCGGVNESEKCV